MPLLTDIFKRFIKNQRAYFLIKKYDGMPNVSRVPPETQVITYKTLDFIVRTSS